MAEQPELDICATLPERDDVVDCVRSRGFLLDSGAKRFRHTGKTLVKRLQAAPELAQQICLSLRLGMSARAVAIKFSISPNSVQAIRLALRERGELEAVAKGVDRVLDEFIELAAERIKEGILLGQIHPGQLPIPLMAAIDKRSQRDAGVVLGTGRTEGDVALENLDAAWALARRAVESQSNVSRSQVVDVQAADVISSVVDTSGATAVTGAERVEVVGLGGGDGSAAAAGNGAETGGGGPNGAGPADDRCKSPENFGT
jgi:hypothetical protein